MHATTENRFSIRDIVLIGMFAALLAVISQIAIPTPTGVPITIQVFGVALIGTVLGTRRGMMSLIIYILIGAVGAPVFANFHGGFQVIVSTAGGYILAWPMMAGFAGIQTNFQNKRINVFLNLVFALIGLIIVEIVGALQWAYLTEGNLGPIIAYSFAAFIPKDIIITVLAVLLGRPLRRQIALTLR